MPEVHGSTHFQAIEIMNEPEAVLSEPAPNPPQHASPITIIQNRSSLISYEALGIEKDEFDKAIEQSKNLPQVLVWAGAYELFGVGVYKSSLIEVLGSIGQCWLRIGIVYAAQAYTYPPAQAGFVTGLVIAIYIYTFAMSSGAHFNSLITFTSMCTGHLPIVRGLLYIPSQVLGWYIGAEMMRAGMDRSEALKYGLGGCNPGTKTYSQAFVIEFMFCLMLMFPVYGTAFNPRQREIFGPIFPPILIGITIAILIYIGPSLGSFPFTGAGMNPSACSGIALSLANIPGTDDGAIFRHHSVYWVAPIVVSLLHAPLYALMPPHHESIISENDKKKKMSAKQH